MRSNEDKTDPLRPRRRFSLWTLLAPAALLVFVFLAFNAIGESCVIKDCESKSSSSKEEDEAPKKTLPKGVKPTCLNTPDLCPPNAQYTVREGENASVIAARFELTEDELTACNKNVDIVSLRTGTKLFISPKRCKGADLADAGANPDPLGDDVSVGAGAGTG